MDSWIQKIKRSQKIGFMESRGKVKNLKYENRKHRWIKNRKYKICLLTVKKTGGEEIIITLQ